VKAILSVAKNDGTFLEVGMVINGGVGRWVESGSANRIRRAAARAMKSYGRPVRVEWFMDDSFYKDPFRVEVIQ